MSLNNYILISETKKGFIGSERDIETNSVFSEKVFSSLREAIKWGQKIENEYGLHFKLICQKRNTQ